MGGLECPECGHQITDDEIDDQHREISRWEFEKEFAAHKNRHDETFAMLMDKYVKMQNDLLMLKRHLVLKGVLEGTWNIS